MTRARIRKCSRLSEANNSKVLNIGKLPRSFLSSQKLTQVISLRLLEEVDILRHLSTPIPHRNVLHFVDGWEQDQMLYIQTELCELGNLADFLLEFGITFNRLDEPRLWKILSELGNVSIHFAFTTNVSHSRVCS
jgi:hypothetical protein